MIRLNCKLLAGVALPALLTACSSGVQNPATPPVATAAPAAVALQNQFGAVFSALFGASAEVEATEPAAGAAGTPDLTKEATEG